jgi:hypothetical protein
MRPFFKSGAIHSAGKCDEPGEPGLVAKGLLRAYGRVHCSEFCSTWYPVYVTA